MSWPEYRSAVETSLLVVGYSNINVTKLHLSPKFDPIFWLLTYWPNWKSKYYSTSKKSVVWINVNQQKWNVTFSKQYTIIILTINDHENNASSIFNKLSHDAIIHRSTIVSFQLQQLDSCAVRFFPGAGRSLIPVKNVTYNRRGVCILFIAE
jgi:hypothetical protein